MFQRRRPLTFWQKTREAVWPSMGWWRTLKYVRHRVVRLSDSTNKIAAGLAVGFSISFSPLVGTHFLQCVIICYVMRANLLAALVGTSVGNPWTYPFIWWISYRAGFDVLSLFGWSKMAALPHEMTFNILWHILKTKPLQIFAPWMLGGTLIGVAGWFPAYFIYYRLINAARGARLRAKMRSVHRVAQEVTGQKF